MFLNIISYVQSDVDFVTDLYNLSPIIGCLVICIIYLTYQVYTKEKELKELNKYIRENEIENMKMLEHLSHTLDKVIDNDRNSNNTVLKEINNIKEVIIIKLDNLK